jgi:hypothetical protein
LRIYTIENLKTASLGILENSLKILNIFMSLDLFFGRFRDLPVLFWSEEIGLINLYIL